MYIFEIVIPGTWLDYGDNERRWTTQNLLFSLESHFFEANTALNLFLNALANCSSFMDHDNWTQDAQRRQEIQSLVEQELGNSWNPEHWEEIRFETEIRFKREKWESGKVPREFEHNLPFIYARAFLYALDAFDKFLRVLSKEKGIPQGVIELYAQMSEKFPDLRGVRNTAQHLEDRSRGLGAGRVPQPLELQPVINGAVHAPDGGALILNCLNGTRYGSTMANGHYGEIDVSAESMEHLQEILQAVLNSFSWSGPKQHKPSA